jgi:hypothetical protein
MVKSNSNNSVKKNNSITKMLKPKYLWILVAIIFSLYILKLLTYNINTNEGFSNINDKVKAPKFKGEKNNDSIKIDKFANPLAHFGFKYSKEENFNNTGAGASNDRAQNALDEADRLDINALSVNNMKGILHQYNKNITEQLEDVKDENNMINVMNQGKIFINEFRKLFDVGLFI